MTIDSVPSSLFRHEAWLSWKEGQGWNRVDTGLGFSLLMRPLAQGGSMAYAAGPHELPGVRLEDPDDRGLVLEKLSQRVCPSLPRDCHFIRWDLMTEAWRDGQGQSLARPLQELRMNASTRYRSLRKAAAELTCPDTMVVELSGGREAILGRMDARTRYSLRLAERRGTRVEERGEEGIGRFHQLFAETALRQDLRLYPETLYRDLFRSAQRHGLDLRLYLATYQGKDAASAIVARDGTEAWYLFAASASGLREAAGPSAILFRALLDAEKAGCLRMDLLGVGPPGDRSHPLAGLTLFKSGFGGRRVTRAGAWDYVLCPHEYARHSLREGLY